MEVMTKPFISAVITCLNEERTIELFVDSLIRALDRTQDRYEIVLVNDGSTDRTFDAITRLFERHSCIQAGLDLMRNSGQAAALTAGIGEASGEYVLMIDSDLQLSPEDVGLLIAAAKEGADMVNGYRYSRQDPRFRKACSIIANWVMRRVGRTRLRDLGCTFRLINRALIQAFELGPDRTLSIPLLLSRAGRVVEVPVRHKMRPEGQSGWTLRKLWSYQADNMVVLAEPLFQWVALASIVAVFLLLVRVALDPFLHWRLFGNVTSGLLLNSVAASTLLVVSLMCIVGEFVVRCHHSVLGRPAYVVRRRLSRR